MNRIAGRRQEIYDYFHGNAACQQYFFDTMHEERYVAYYNSMYLLQDSTESLWQHRNKGFSGDPLLAYIEFWGVMQAVIIQQDSISELFEVITNNKFSAKPLESWSQLRALRNACAGHPAKKDLPKSAPLSRTFMARSFGNYESITYECWEHSVGTTHRRVKLGSILDSYAAEAEGKLSEVIVSMRVRWPK
jgi:hypothetical protein